MGKRHDLPLALLSWYSVNRRDLPWRLPPGEKNDPYRVWLSEIMLQQTTVATVIPYYRKFLKKWPKLADLAAAEEEEILHEWAGLGYYSRARNLHACAQKVMETHRGIFPQTEKELEKLPGIGPYTAAAVAAIAFGERTAPVDGNLERVLSRLNTIQTPLPSGKKEIRTAAQSLFDALPKGSFAGDLAQALMDLGAGPCSPKAPVCWACPVQGACRAARERNPEDYPRRLKTETKKPLRYGEVYILFDKSGALQIERRPDKGLLAGMKGLPTTEWVDVENEDAACLARAGKTLMRPKAAAKSEKIGQVRHSFTHFNLILDVRMAKSGKNRPGNKDWPSGLPRVFAKALEVAKQQEET